MEKSTVRLRKNMAYLISDASGKNIACLGMELYLASHHSQDFSGALEIEDSLKFIEDNDQFITALHIIDKIKQGFDGFRSYFDPRIKRQNRLAGNRIQRNYRPEQGQRAQDLI